jgi:hypothetical protein
MATSNSTQILVDTTKRTVIKRVGIFDTAGGNEALTVVIDPRTLSGALNANNLPYQTGNTVATGFVFHLVSPQRNEKFFVSIFSTF